MSNHRLMEEQCLLGREPAPNLGGTAAPGSVVPSQAEECDTRYLLCCIFLDPSHVEGFTLGRGGGLVTCLPHGPGGARLAAPRPRAVLGDKQHMLSPAPPLIWDF